MRHDLLMSNESTFDAVALKAIGELLALGEDVGLGITFLPDDDGWTVGYMVGTSGGGDLVSGYDLGDTARASIRPLMDVVDRIVANKRDD